VIFIQIDNEFARGLFFELMVFLYDFYEKLRPQVKSSLIRGLSDKSPMIRAKLVAFWSDQNRLSLDPTKRLQ
jgi:hypothetical protein